MNIVKCQLCFDFSAPRDEKGYAPHKTFESETQEDWGLCPTCCWQFDTFGHD